MIIVICEFFGILIVFVYFLIPLILYIFPHLFSKFIFLNFEITNNLTDLSKPDLFGFNRRNWRNIKIKTDNPNIELGAWQIISKDDENFEVDFLDEIQFLKIFCNGRPIILYFHGNSMHRGSRHRVQLYHILRESGYHILTVDYRGFGDSSGSICNEEEAQEDAISVFNFIKQIAPNCPLFIWGHSLGTGISSLLLNKLGNQVVTSSINGLILESPFTSMLDTMDHISLTRPWRCMPYFNPIFKQSLINLKLTFNSIENLKNVDIPILILHAEDDKVLSYEMGTKLFTALLTVGKNIKFNGFKSHLKFGHDNILRSPELPNLIKNFTRNLTP